MNSKTRTARIGLAGLALAAALTVAAGPAAADIPLSPSNEPTAVADTTGAGTGSWSPATGSANSNVLPFISPGSAEIMTTVTNATGSTCRGCTNTPR